MSFKYPIFIPSKGRCATRKTARAFDAIGVPYREVIEEDDAASYEAAGAKNLLVMPQHDAGVVITRNWIWDHAEELGTPRYWSFDDNIIGFCRLNNNLKFPLSSGSFLRAMEDFTERYSNVPISGMNYRFFGVQQKSGRHKPFQLNTRVYSNMLILTDATDPRGRKYRFEGFYNEDTDLCLRVLKDGFCTILFNAFMMNKSATMTVSGGNTPNYQGDGRYKMAKELQQKHPDVTRITRKWGRWQHHVDYRPFAKNQLRRRRDIEIKPGVDNYGMELVKADRIHAETADG